MQNNYFKTLNLILQHIDEVDLSEELQQKFIERTKKHVNSVNEYAKKINRTYPNHDSSKFDELLLGYCLYCKENRNKYEDKLLDAATLAHIRNASHHPEYWAKDYNFEKFTRKNFTPCGPIDVTAMPIECLEELCCDWCSTSKEYGNTPFEWFSLVNGNRWIFSPDQQRFIRKTLKILW